MMQSRRSENGMLATVRSLRRLLRKADLATKRVRVMATEIFYTATSSCCRDGLPGITLRSETRQAASLREGIGAAGRARRPSLHRRNLPRWCARDDIHEVNLARLLVPGETVGDEVAEFFVKSVRGHEAFAQDDKGARDFSGVEVRFGDYAAVADSGMFQEEGFDFGGRDGESFVIDHLFAAVEDVVEAIGITTHDVTGEIPSIAKNGGGGLRVPPVSEHDLRAAHGEFAGLARSGFIPVKINDATIRESQWLS